MSNPQSKASAAFSLTTNPPPAIVPALLSGLTALSNAQIKLLTGPNPQDYTTFRVPSSAANYVRWDLYHPQTHTHYRISVADRWGQASIAVLATPPTGEAWSKQLVTQDLDKAYAFLYNFFAPALTRITPTKG